MMRFPFCRPQELARPAAVVSASARGTEIIESNPMPKPMLLLLLISTLVVGAVLAVRHAVTAEAKPAAASSPQAAKAAHALAINQALSQLPVSELPAPGALPASLQGADHGVHLRLDARGNVVLDAGLIRIFDFYLAGLGEETLDKVLARIHLALARQLSGAALTQARELLRRYVDYRIALARLDAPAPPALSPAAARQRLDAVRQLRRRYFSIGESQAFFGADDAEDDYLAQRLALTQDNRLPAAEQARQLDALERRLPDTLRAQRQRAMVDAEIYAAAEKMKAEGASKEAIYQLRAQALGDVAARNLEQLDVQRMQWQQRLQAYAEQRQQILAAGLSEPQRQTALQALLDEGFDALEQKRVIALQGGR